MYRNKRKLNEWLKTNLYYVNPKLGLIESSFVDTIFNTLFESRRLRNLHLYRDALDCFIANLIYCGRKKVPLTKPIEEMYVAYPFIKTAIIKNVFEILCENGYCEFWKGKVYKKHSKRYFLPRKYYPTTKLMNEFLHTRAKKPKSFVMLYKKDSKKRRIPKEYPETWFTRKLKSDVDSINKLLESANVKFKYKTYNFDHECNPSFETQIEYLLHANHLKLTPNQTSEDTKCVWFTSPYGDTLYIGNEYEFEINKESMYVYRSFNRGKFEFGGRFYTPVFQSIPSIWRPTITIDGEETVELDYSAHHIRMLYHENGLDFKGEPYIYEKNDLENKDKRTLHKYIAMIAINASNRIQSINAVRNSIEDDSENGKYQSEIPDKKTIELLYDEFLEYHKPISHCVSNDEGIKLQRKDSDVMNDILINLTKKQIVGLPIHDSIVIQSKHKEILKEEMTNQYYKYLKKLPKIT